MTFLERVVALVRRYTKSASNSTLKPYTILDAIDRFCLIDMPARLELFEFKTTYQFVTTPGIASYNTPLVPVSDIEGTETIAPYPLYQGFIDPVVVNGTRIPLTTLKNQFTSQWGINLAPVEQVATGDGTTTTFAFSLPYAPIVAGHVNTSGILASNSAEDPIISNDLIPIPSQCVSSSVFISYIDDNGFSQNFSDSGQFLNAGSDQELLGLLMYRGGSLSSNISLNTYSATQNVVNYSSGDVYITFPSAPPSGSPITVQLFEMAFGQPTACLFFDNTIMLYPPPDQPYTISLDAYLTPASFLSSPQAVPYAYMLEYIALGAALKLMNETGDVEQISLYKPLFIEAESNVYVRSQRTKTQTPSPTIYNQGYGYLGSSVGLGFFGD